MARPDLNQPAEWNAVDATPQEPSPLAPGEPYRAGPAYVPFIRADMRNTSYDAYFILAEVNAQKVCPETGKLLPSAVGKAVVTKKPGMARNIYDPQNPQVITKFKVRPRELWRKIRPSPSLRLTRAVSVMEVCV